MTKGVTPGFLDAYLLDQAVIHDSPTVELWIRSRRAATDSTRESSLGVIISRGSQDIRISQVSVKLLVMW